MIHLESDHLGVVRDILKHYVPHYEVRIFGSRATGENIKKYSDIDLAVMTEKCLPAGVWSDLKDAFSESMLPMRVDVLDWSTVSSEFRKVIEANYEVVQSASVGQLKAGPQSRRKSTEPAG